jgi:undecaprenyl diphosphate synthase
MYLPQHVGLIMDGNGRWATKRRLSRTMGHRAATRNVLELVDYCSALGIPYMTLYTFSTENWRRPTHEVAGMFQVISEFLDQCTEALHTRGVRLRHLGRTQGISDDLQRKANYALDLTRQNSRLNLSIAFNYSGRADIVEAVRRIVSGGLTDHDIDEHTITTYLSTAELPDPDLVIRTSGEQRLSNFLIWESAYSLCWTTPIFWPDFRAEHLQQALDAYAETQLQACSVPE